MISYAEGTVTIDCETKDAKVYYTLDNTTPGTTSQLYGKPFTIDHNLTVKAVAYKDGALHSGVADYFIKTFKVDAPKFNYDDKDKLEITSETKNAKVYYRLETDDAFKEYNGALTLTDNRKVYACAKAENFIDSDTKMFEPTNFRCEPVEITFQEPLLKMSCKTSGSVIRYYTVNGKENVYNESIEIIEPCEVYAYAEKQWFNNSDTAYYNIIRCEEPVIGYADGNVEIYCETKDAKVYYTLDGSVPDATSLLYSEPFTVSHNLTVKAVAYKDGALRSVTSEFVVDDFRCDPVVLDYDKPWLSMSCETEGATIHYMIDDVEKVYSEPLMIVEPTVVHAWAEKEYYHNSDTVILEVAPSEMFCIGGIWYRVESYRDLTCSVIHNGDDCNMYHGNIEIPEAVERFGKPFTVIAIADSVFTDCIDVTSIILPESVTSVGKDALKTGNLNMLVYVEGVGSREQVVGAGYSGNLVVDGKADWIVLHDGYDFSCPLEFEAGRISYDREFTMHTGKGFTEGWETLALPFDVTTIWHKTKGTEIDTFKALEEDGVTEFNRYSPVKPFWLFGFGDNGFEASDKIEAYKPYIISMPNNEEYIEALRLPGVVSFRAEKQTIQPSSIPTSGGSGTRLVPTTVRIGAAEDVWVLNSIFDNIDNLDELDNLDNLESSDYLPGSVFIRGLRDVLPFEAYLEMERGAGSRVAIRLNELMDETNGIVSTQIPYLKNNNRHNLLGLPVDEHYKGIVIEGGRKTLRR